MHFLLLFFCMSCDSVFYIPLSLGSTTIPIEVNYDHVMILNNNFKKYQKYIEKLDKQRKIC